MLRSGGRLRNGGVMLAQEERAGCAHGRRSIEDLAVAKVIECDELGTGVRCRNLLGIGEDDVGIVARMQEQGWSSRLLEQIEAGEIRNIAANNGLEAPLVGALRLRRQALVLPEG